MKERLIIYSALVALVVLLLTVYDHYIEQVSTLEQHIEISQKNYVTAVKLNNEQIIKRLDAESEIERMSMYYDSLLRDMNIKYDEVQLELNQLKNRR